MRDLLVLALCYLGAGVSTNLFLFHLPVAQRRLDPRTERLRLARGIPPLARLADEQGDEQACRAVVLGTLLLWPLFVVPLFRWLDTLRR